MNGWIKRWKKSKQDIGSFLIFSSVPVPDYKTQLYEKELEKAKKFHQNRENNEIEARKEAIRKKLEEYLIYFYCLENMNAKY